MQRYLTEPALDTLGMPPAADKLNQRLKGNGFLLRSVLIETVNIPFKFDVWPRNASVLTS
jgi:hypothetical protein